MPCRTYLGEVRERLDEVAEAGARFVVVGGHADYQARHLRDDRGISDVPLLLDPDQELRRLAGLGRMRRRDMVSWRGVRNYLSSFGRGSRPGRVVAGYDLRPGVILVSPELNVEKVWSGDTWGDYPDFDEVLSELGRRAP
ncbi:MAG: peroxiredoxin family protein [Acidimicrobiales bacterium]